jgi:hypothetical protein
MLRRRVLRERCQKRRRIVETQPKLTHRTIHNAKKPDRDRFAKRQQKVRGGGLRAIQVCARGGRQITPGWNARLRDLHAGNPNRKAQPDGQRQHAVIEAQRAIAQPAIVEQQPREQREAGARDTPCSYGVSSKEQQVYDGRLDHDDRTQGDQETRRASAAKSEGLHIR